MKTRNTFFVAMLLMTASLPVCAQQHFGLRAGTMVSTFADKGDLLDNSNVTVSYAAGVFGSIPISKAWLIQPEVNFFQKGRSMENTELNTSVETDYKIHYLQVPILLQFRDDKTLNSTGTAFYINAGPYAAFALDSKTKPVLNNAITEDLKTDFGATLGVGLQTPIFHQNFRFDLRYDLGLSEIGNQPADYRTKGLSLTVGIML